MSLAPVHDLERLRIDRDTAPRRPLAALDRAGAAGRRGRRLVSACARLRRRAAGAGSRGRSRDAGRDRGGRVDRLAGSRGQRLRRRAPQQRRRREGRRTPRPVEVRGRNPRAQGRGDGGDRARRHRRSAGGVAPRRRGGRGPARPGGREPRRGQSELRPPARADEGRHHDRCRADRPPRRRPRSRRRG